jgi:hypothetical protein
VFNIALIGKARSGKDTAANFLVREHAYTRVAFADPLKEMALSIDPLVTTSPTVYVRLRSLIRAAGWEYAKDHYPEVRRLLQRIGQTQREHDPDYWVSVARRKLSAAESWNLPVVVTDVRYANEADMLRSRGFRLVRLARSGTAVGTHRSETELDSFAADCQIHNDGDLAQLRRAIMLAAGA